MTTTTSTPSLPQVDTIDKMVGQMYINGAPPDGTQEGGQDAFLRAVRQVEELKTALANQPDRVMHAALRAMVEAEPNRDMMVNAVSVARVFVNEELLQRFMGTCATPYGRHWENNAFTLDAFLQRPPKQWHVDRVVGVGDLALLYGSSGEGKTHIALDLAFACLTGTTFAENFAVTKPMTVVYATGEGVGGLADRLRAVSGYYQPHGDNLYIFTDIPQLFDTAQENGAQAFMHAWRQMAEDGRVPESVDLLILDTMHNATAGADENSAGDASVVQATLRTLRAELGCAIVMVHHAGKNGDKERGSSAIRASCDTVLRCAKSDGKFKLSCEKLKDGQEWPAQAFDLVEVNGGGSVRVFWEGDAKSVTDGTRSSGVDPRILACLQGKPGHFFTPDELAKAIDHESAVTVHNRLRLLAAAGTIEKRNEHRTAKDGSNRGVNVYGVTSTPTELENGRGW